MQRQSTAAALGLTDAVGRGGGERHNSKTCPRLTNLSFDLVALSLICDCQPRHLHEDARGPTYFDLGLTIESHGLSHRIGTPTWAARASTACST